MLKDLKLYIQLLKKYLKPYRGKLAIGFFISLFFSFISLSTPFITRFLIDKVLLSKNVDMLSVLLIIMLILIIFLLFTDLLGNYILIVVFQEISRDIKVDFFKKLQEFSISFFSDKKVGELNYRLFTDTNIIKNSLASMPLNIINHILVLLTIGTTLYIWNWKLFLIIISVFVIQAFIIAKFKDPIFKYSKLSKEKSASISSFTIEQFASIELVKVSGNILVEQKKFKDKLNDLIKTNVRYFLVKKYSNISISIVNNIWSYVILWYGGVEVINGNMSVGTLMAFMLLSGMMFGPISSITRMFTSFQDVRTSLHRYSEYYNQENEIVEKPTAYDVSNLRGDIVIENISFGYHKDKLILKDFNVHFKPNSIVSIIGKSGVGKTSICRLIYRFYDPSKGRILIDGHDLKDLKLESYQKNIGIFLQNQFVFSGSIKENITYGCEGANMGDIILAAKQAKAHGFIENLPDLYNTLVGENGVKISGGEAQRIALARLFLKKPKIIIMDEPTSFLDLQIEQDLKKAILKLKEKATVIIITHKISTMQIADKIILIEDQKATEIPDFTELSKQRGIYKKILDDMVK